MNKIYTYIFIMAIVSFIIRALPLTVIKKQIKNTFIQSFLYYVPYVTLAVMTFPAMLHATQNPISGIIAFLTGLFTAWRGFSLFQIASCCCLIVFASELFLI